MTKYYLLAGIKTYVIITEMPSQPPSSSLGHIGANMRALRRWNRMTLVQVADRIKMRPTALGRTERGFHAPAAGTIVALAELLNVPESAFFTRNADALRAYYEASLNRPFLVAEDGQSLMPLDQRLAKELIDSYMAAEDACGVSRSPRVPLAVDFEATEAGMERLAAHVRELLGIRDCIVFDYIELFETMGLRILFAPLRGTESFVHYDPENRNAFFFVRADMNGEKQLFRLLTELGRVYFLTQRMRTPGATGLDGAIVRRLTKVFASRFLMPADAVRATVSQLGVQDGCWTYDLLLRIKHRFGVSAESFLYRLAELGCIDADRAADLKVRIERHYRRTRYGEPDSTRRILSPNGRIGDLLLSAQQRSERRDEAEAIKKRLKALRVRML
jgi:Zn-dependent peptidase ImmA (M78 family)/transcriptional regulator with XRE-family HTH domain